LLTTEKLKVASAAAAVALRAAAVEPRAGHRSVGMEGASALARSVDTSLTL
jgi:hypothetical protein